MKHEEKTFTIVVNGTAHQWPKDQITYKEVVTLAFPNFPEHPDVTYSVKYVRGHGHKPEGTLSPGGAVRVHEGMVFSVNDTGQS